MANPWAMPWQAKYKGKVAILDDYREGDQPGPDEERHLRPQHHRPGQITLSRRTMQELSTLVNVRIDNNDYTEVPDGETWIHHAWSGDMAAAASYMPKGVPVDGSATGSPPTGKGPVANDTTVVLRSAGNPVLAHLFLNYMLDLPTCWRTSASTATCSRSTGVTPQRPGQGADPAAEPAVHGGAAVVLPPRRERAAAARWTRTRCGSRPGSWSATGSEAAAMAARTGRWKHRARTPFWVALAAPGILWLVLLFIVPFYAVLAIAMGQLDQLFESPVAVWNPFAWSSENVIDVCHDLVGSAAFAGPIVVRTRRLRRHRLAALPAHRLSGRVLRGPFRRPAQGAVPDPAHRAVLDQLHDAHAGLDRPAADQRLREQGAGACIWHLTRSTGWAASRSR